MGAGGRSGRSIFEIAIYEKRSGDLICETPVILVTRSGAAIRSWIMAGGFSQGVDFGVTA